MIQKKCLKKIGAANHILLIEKAKVRHNALRQKNTSQAFTLTLVRKCKIMAAII